MLTPTIVISDALAAQQRRSPSRKTMGLILDIPAAKSGVPTRKAARPHPTSGEGAANAEEP